VPESLDHPGVHAGTPSPKRWPRSRRSRCAA